MEKVTAGYRAFNGHVFTASEAARYNAEVERAQRTPGEANENAAHASFAAIIAAQTAMGVDDSQTHAALDELAGKGFAPGDIVRLDHKATFGRYAATHGALARITGLAPFMLPSGRLVQDLVWLQPTSANGQKDGAYCVADFVRHVPGPTTDELAALRSYAIEHGPKWKEDLQLDWYHARLEPCQDMPNRGAILHGVRNIWGPSWLADFAFAAPIEWPNLRRMPAWELRNMITALCLHPWLNTEAENVRLWAARRERRRRASRA